MNCPDNQVVEYDANTFIDLVNWVEPFTTSGQPWVYRTHAPNTYFGRGCTAVYYVFGQDGDLSELCAFTVCLWPEGK